ncbi:MAG: hypothetical protein A2Z20_11750 [Bdellovibrionales bacterium RBG_16_40_8]|nr:MAG: hypothetical protein A2Z20_11750 [Bdellovibrionales bacterium RBG_16_40_8]
MKWKSLDVLINNAGVCFRSVAEQMDAKSELEQMQTNYLGPMMLIRKVLPTMRENGRGKIINVSSAAGLLGMPTMGSYSASKHALEGASESLWHELRPFGINVTVVRTSKSILAEKVSGPFSDFYYYMAKFISMLMGRSDSTSASIAIRIREIIKTSYTLKII